VEFLALSADTPRFNLSIITMAPGHKGPEAHVHDDEDDAFYVLDGELSFVIGDDEFCAAAGTFVLVPPGVVHTFSTGRRTPSGSSTSMRRPDLIVGCSTRNKRGRPESSDPPSSSGELLDFDSELERLRTVNGEWVRTDSAIPLIGSQ
jgi:uncharacterized cupin superfamily protein